MKTFYKIALFFVLLVSACNVFAQENEGQKGIELYNQGDYQKAAGILQKAAEAAGTDRDLWLFAGMALARADKKDEARQAFKKAGEIAVKAKTDDETEVKVISKPRAKYTDQARRNNVQGTVTLAVEFLSNGKIGFVFPLKTLPDGLTEKCVEATRGVEFKPAKKGDKAVTKIRTLSYSFTIY